MRDRFVRALVALVALSLIAALGVAITGGFGVLIGRVLVRSHSWVPGFTIALLGTAIALVFGRAVLPDALSWWWQATGRRAGAAALLLAVLTGIIALRWGTYVAGGSDSYCYLNEAELFARGQVHDFEPLATDRSWPGTSFSFVPAGHTEVPGQPGRFVAICPAGYPVLLAAAKIVGGREAMFWITPVMSALVVWLTFLLGKRLAGPPTGLLAAILVAFSPPFLFQAMQVMNDTTATAAWCAVLVAASRRDATSLSRSLLTGGLAGAALTVRPNLLPLTVPVGLWVAFSAREFRPRAAAISLVAFGLALLPGVLFVMAIQNAMYGSPLHSGYGDLSSLFSTRNIIPNLSRYPRWLVEVHTPLILAALAAPFLARDRAVRTQCAWLIVFAAAVIACYLPYVVFEEWWYLRFVLPAVPPLLVLTAFVVVRGIDRLPEPARWGAFVLVSALLAIVYLQTAEKRAAFGSREFEWRFRATGEYVAARLPENAAFITGHHTGSLRFYSGRSTAGWGDIDPGRLDEALAFMRRHGRKPYLLFETWEEPHFRSRFGKDRLGALAWPARVEINDLVRIYDPDDYDRNARAEAVETERVVVKRW
jgi:hypothetical protein